jgi:hypothetical protein
MKYKFKEGDGMIWSSSTKEEREKITNLLKLNGYSLFRDYKIDYTYSQYPSNPFNNNFRFRKDGKWVTSNVKQVTNPMTFQEMERLIKGEQKIKYKIY